MFRIFRRPIILSLFALPAVFVSAQTRGVRDGDRLTLSNNAISATWSVSGGVLRWQSLTNRFTGATLQTDGSPFELIPKEGPVLRSQDFKITGDPTIDAISTHPNSSRAAEHLPGQQIRVELQDSSANLHITWKAMLRDAGNYLRQEVTIHAVQQPFPLSQLVLVDAIFSGAAVSGSVK